MIESEKFMRLDKFLCENNIGTRSQVKDAIRKGMVTINGTVAKKPEEKIEETKDIIAFQGQELRYQKYVYYMLNKPEGVVSATNDNTAPTVLELLPAQGRKDLFPVGRLDKDSEGLLLMTNDGDFANTLMHPANHIGKTYRVTVRPGISEDQLVKLSSGVLLDDGYTTQPAQVHVLDQQPGRVVLQMTITEGKNRQIRRMCEAVGLEVARLKRTYIGPVKLGMLQPGEYRELTPAELSAIRGYMNKAVNRRQNAEGEKAAAERGSRPAKKAPVKPAGKGRTPLGRR